MLGKDLIKDVLPNLGPDWGLCVTAPPAKDKTWFPQVTLAMAVAPGPGTAPVDEALFVSQVVERVAHMRLMTSAIGAAIPIPPEFVRSERDRWLYKYGTAADHSGATS